MYAWGYGLQKIIIPAKDMIIQGNRVLGCGHVIFKSKTVKECEAFIARWAARDSLKQSMKK